MIRTVPRLVLVLGSVLAVAASASPVAAGGATSNATSGTDVSTAAESTADLSLTIPQNPTSSGSADVSLQLAVRAADGSIISAQQASTLHLVLRATDSGTTYEGRTSVALTTETTADGGIEPDEIDYPGTVDIHVSGTMHASTAGKAKFADTDVRVTVTTDIDGNTTTFTGESTLHLVLRLRGGISDSTYEGQALIPLGEDIYVRVR